MSLTVRELREALATLPDDMEVYLQSDAEGNGYERLRICDPDGIANPHEPGILSAEWSADEACMDEEEWDQLRQGPRVLVLSP